MTARPHDALFKAAFGAPADAAGLFKTVLPPEAVAALEWSTIARVDGSFVDPDLADRHSDILFSTRVRGSGDEVLLYLLIEHQSSVDPDMPLRVLGYQVRIWERHRGRPRPLILPFVLAHAPGGWNAPVRFEAQFAPHPDELGVGEWVPRFTVTIVDLARRTDEEIMAWSLGVFQKLALWVMRDGRDAARFQAALPRWKRLFADAHAAALRAPHGMRALAQLLHYVWHVTGNLRFAEFRARLLEHLPEAEDVVMTIYEEILEEGRAQGRVEATASVLRRLLTLKFGALDPDLDARIEAAPSTQIERYLERFATASSLSDVFGR